MKICLILEGCYPYIHGGVSTWTHSYIQSMKEHEFVLWVVGAQEKEQGRFVYELPEHVTEIHEVFLDTALDTAILDLKDYLSEERLTEMVEKYSAVVKPYLERMPDSMYSELTTEDYDTVAEAIPGEIDQNYRLYLESLEKPMPFFIGPVQEEDGKLMIYWDVSYDFDAENIMYTVEVTKDYTFQDVMYKEKQELPEVSLDMPDAGQYFVRVRAENESEKTQDAFDYYVSDEGKWYGIKCFYVLPDGTIGEDEYEE